MSVTSRFKALAAIAGSVALIAAACSSSPGAEDNVDADAQDVSDEPINLGLLIPCSGIYAIACDPIQDGVEYWLDEHDNKLAGRDVNVVVADDQSTTDGAVSAAEDLIRKDEVSAVVGMVNSAGALAARPTLMRSEVITMSVVANATELLDTEDGPYMFMINPAADGTDGPAAVLAKEQGWDNFVGIADNYDGTRSWLGPSLDAMEELGITVKERIYPPFPTQDYGPYVNSLAEENPDAVAPVMFGPGASGFIKAYQSFGQEAPLYTSGTMLEPTSVSQDLMELAEGEYAYWNYSPLLDTPENTEFVEGFIEAYDRTPGGFEMQSYVALEFLNAAYEEVGGDDSPESLRSALQQVEVPSPVGDLSLGEEQSVDWDIFLTEVEEGPNDDLVLSPVGPYIEGVYTGMTLEEAESALAQLP